MELIVVIVVIMFISMVASSMEARALAKASKSNAEKLTVTTTKQCPPHEWFFQEVVDQEGKKISERIVCKRCGPLPDGGF